MNPPDEAIRGQLKKILTSPGFVHSDRLRRFLTYSIEQTLAGKPENLKEYGIGLEAFDRPTHYSPSEDPIVRVEARRLRKKLEEYYAALGQNDPILIELPKGSYVPTFHSRPQSKPKPVPKALYFAIPVLAAAVVVLIVLIYPRTPKPDTFTLTRLTTDGGLTTDAALSSDGTTVVYASDRAGAQGLDLWIQKLPSGDPRRLTSDPADDHQPSLSPDSTTVAFRSERQPPGIYLTPVVAGSEAHLLAPDGRDPRFSPDGQTIAYWIGSPGDDFLPSAGKLFLIPSSGGAAQSFLPDLLSASCPVWSPNGRRLLFLGVARPGDSPDWWTAPLTSGPAQPTGAASFLAPEKLSLPIGECAASWQPGGLIFSARSGDALNLWRLPVDDSGHPSGSLHRLTFGSSQETRPSASSSGAVVFSSRIFRSQIWAYPGSSPLTEGTATSSFPSVSHDGARIAFLSDRKGSPQVFWKDLPSGKEVLLTQPPTQPRYPQISPAGDRIVFTDYSTPEPKTYLASPNGEPPQQLPITGARVWDFSSSRLVFQQPGSLHQAMLFDLPTRQQRTLLQYHSDVAGLRLSPDRKWLAFHAIPTAVRRQLLLVPYPSGEPTPLLSEDHMDRNATWSPDGRSLYFLSERDGYRCIWAVSPAGGRPRAIRHFHSARHSLSAFGDVGAIGLSAASGKIIFSLADTTSNLWLLTPAKR